MTDEYKLETPDSYSDLYLAIGEEADEFRLRPAFTGDLFRVPDGRLVALVQHPCAMRRGVALAAKLLVCDVLPNRSGVPRDWSSGNFKRMFLPDLNGESLAIEFEQMDVLGRETLLPENRVAMLSSRGVNLLVQRWIYHNSRVTIPTITINSQVAGPFEEADLIQEATEDLVATGNFDDGKAANLVDEWLSMSESDGSAPRREILADPQQRSTVRTSLRRQVKSWAD